MKKFLLSLGLVAMVLNLTNCAQYEDVNTSVKVKGNFELYASISRTANDGLNTVWSEGDALNVFHAVTDATTYTQDGEFKLEDAANGYFLGNLNGTLDSQEEYDWYAMYPYNAKVTTPAAVDSGYVTVGCSATGNQTQTGNNSMAHVAGKNYPIVGKVYAVPAGTSPALAMTHVASLLEFEVTNSLEEAITVTNIKFTTPSYIVGTFYVNYADINNIVAASSGSSYTSKSANLVVENGEAIAKGESAKFYLPVAPFTAAANAKLAIEVTVTSGEKVGMFIKEITLADAVSFKSGKIKTVKVNYNAEFVEEGLALPFEDDFARFKLNASEPAISDLGDSYLTFTKIYQSKEIDGGIKFGTSSAAGSITTVALNLSEPFTVILTAKNYGTDATKVNVTAGGVTKQVALSSTLAYYAVEFDALSKAESVTVASSADSKQRLHLDDLQVVAGHDVVLPTLPPVLTVSTEEISGVSHEGEAKTFTYSVANPVEGTTATVTDNVDWITTADNNGTVTVTVAANEAEEAREGVITVTYGDLTKTVTVKQNAKPAEGGVVTGTVTYTVSSTSACTTSGTAPSGSTAAYKNTYTSNKEQMTKGNTATFTLSGYTGATIKAITLKMKSNKSAGAGKFSAVAGSTTLAAISSATNFNNWYDNTSYSTSYCDVHVTLTNDTYVIQSGENVVIKLEATTNSIYIQSVTIDYEIGSNAGGGETPETPEVPATPVLSINPTTLSFEAAGGNKDVTCTIENEISGVNVTATEDVDWLSTSVNGKVVTVTATENTATETRTATVTIAYEGAESKTVTVSQAAAEQGGNQGGEEPAEKVWTLVTESSTLAVGDQIIIAAKGANVALSTTQNSNNRGQAAITKSGDTLVNPSSSVQIITLEAGSVSGGFAFKAGSAGYLYAASSGSNYLKTKASKDANGSWSIAFSTAGVATIKAQGSNTRNWLRHNSSNSLFSCYSSGQNDVVIYKLQ